MTMTFHPVMADELAKRGAARDAKERGGRERICTGCFVEGTDHILGGLHSELACMRCGKKPCAGVMVVADKNV
jgi:hypothetical protein